jgi:hypothetical protein
LRPSLTRGLPFSIADSNNDLDNWVSQAIGLIAVMTNQIATLTLPCDQFVSWPHATCLACPAFTAAPELVDRYSGWARQMSATHSWHRRPNWCPVFKILRSCRRTTPTMPVHPQRWQTPRRCPCSCSMPSETYVIYATPLVVQLALPNWRTIKHGMADPVGANGVPGSAAGAGTNTHLRHHLAS